MSCGDGNRFSCGMRRFNKHSFTPDKPSNTELYNENQKRYADLMKSREDLDKLFIQQPTNTENTENKNILTTSNELVAISTNIINNTNNSSQYTPWKTPQATYK